MLTSGAPPHPVWPYFVDVRDAARAHVKALEAPSLSRYPSIPPTDPSHESESGTGQVSGLSPRSRPVNLTIPRASSNPSLVDLGSTLEKLELSYQPTPGSPTSLHANSGTDAPYFHPAGPLSPASPSPSASPTTHIQTRAPRKRFVATGTSFTWPDAITYLRTALPDLSSSLPDERTCLPMPETVAQLEGRWSGAGFARAALPLHVEGTADGHVEGAGDSSAESGDGTVWNGLGIQWRDWRETVEDAVADLERVAGGLEESGWEDLFGSDEGVDATDDDDKN
jgi:hypothetical protein